MGEESSAVLAVLARLEASQSRLEAGQAKLEAGQAKLSSDVERLETSCAKLEASQTTLRRDVMASIERVNDQITAMRQDVLVGLGAVEHVRRLNLTSRDEGRALADLVYGMEQQILSLSGRVSTLEGH